MTATARIAVMVVLGVLLSGAAGYGLAELDEQQSETAAPPLSVVCSASMASLDRLAGQVADPSAERVSADPVDAELTVLSQQRLRLDGTSLDGPRRRLARALDASLLTLSRAQQRVGSTGEVEASALQPAVTAAVSRVRQACPAP